MKLSVCDRIDRILSERKMSRRQLALKAGIPPSTLQSALARKKNMSIEMIQLIANALDISMDELLGMQQLHAGVVKYKDGKKYMMDSEAQERFAVSQYLERLGYHPVYIKSTFFTEKEDFWVIRDSREDVVYYLEEDQLYSLEDSINAFSKFQISELVRNLEKVEDSKLKKHYNQIFEGIKKREE